MKAASILERTRMSVLRGVGGLMSPAGARGRLLVLLYHRVLPRPDPMRRFDVDAAVFNQHMQALKDNFSVCSLSEALERLRWGEALPRMVCVTFDDGYADNYEVAYPILRRYGIPAAFFVSSGYLEGGIMWNDRVVEAVRQATGSVLDLVSMGLERYPLSSLVERERAGMSVVFALRYLEPAAREEAVTRLETLIGATRAAELMLSFDQLRALHRNGMEIGGHTINHPILKRIPAEEARREILENKKQLEAIVGARLRFFAYPNGRPGIDYDAEHVEMVKESGFAAAVTTAWGAARSSADFYQLPRVALMDATPLRFTLRLLRAYAASLQQMPTVGSMHRMAEYR